MIPGVLGYVLAGGESSRMQRADLPRDKALILFQGQTLLERALQKVASVCQEPRILCGPPHRCKRLESLGVTVPDLVTLSGPLGGLQAALEDARARRAEWVLLMPVDLPWMTCDVLHGFVHEALQRGSAAACMADAQHVQPLPCIVHTAAAMQVNEALQAGERKLLPLLKAVGETCGTRAGLAILQPADLESGSIAASRSFWNINTPEDLESLQNMETPGSEAHQSKHG